MTISIVFIDENKISIKLTSVVRLLKTQSRLWLFLLLEADGTDTPCLSVSTQLGHPKTEVVVDEI